MPVNTRISRWMGLSLGALLLFAGCSDDVPVVDDTGSSGSSSGGEPVTTTPTPPIPTTTDMMTGDGSTTSGVDTTAGMDTTAGSGTTGVDTTAGIVCGNDMVEDGEACDGPDLAGEDCVTQGFVAGRLACADDCTFDTRGCADRLCGDDTVQGMEVCDGTDLAGEDCATQGFDGGTLACLGGCRGFDTSGCFACGDGMIDGMEVCDGDDLGGQDCTAQGFDGGTLGCLPDCSGYDATDCFACGDDMVGGLEVCDGADLGGQDCTTQGFDGGALGCLPDCSGFDATDCFTCGDDVIGGMEVCDGNELGVADCLSQGFDFGTLGCLGDCSGYDTTGCGSFGGGCCTANGTPGCDDATCTTDVCAVDPFCCDIQWDQICANLAFTSCPALCDNCGDGMINSPIEVCDGAALGGEDCTTQGFDTGVLGCQPDCTGFDTSGCVTFGGECCAGNGTPGCDDPACTAAICAVDPFCCANQWDVACAGQAAFEPACQGLPGCTTCGNDLAEGLEACDGVDLQGEDCTTQGFDLGTLGCLGNCSAFDTSACQNFMGDCCTAHGTPGCNVPACSADVCAADPFCCDTQWDQLCADTAFTVCPAVCTNCGDNAVNSPAEVCDGVDTAGQTCITQGFDYGTLGCQADCSGYDTSQCSDFSGGCCTSRLTPGCEDAGCTAAICAVNSFCCSSQWDLLCALSALAEPACQGTSDCTTCGDDVVNGVEICDGADLSGETCATQGFGGGTLACSANCASFDTTACIMTNSGQSCCSPSGGASPGCSDAICTDSICMIDPFCCNTDWDSVCANRANGSDGNGQQCDICGFGCNQELCAEGTENSICLGSNACVDAICGLDPFCCNNSWDNLCVGEVASICGLACP